MPTVQIPEKLLPLFVKPKRLKVAVGGRGPGKSISFGDAFVRFAACGEKVLCAREFQNSIDESVHSLLLDRIRTLGVGGFTPSAKDIAHRSGGLISYRGLARNIQSLKSLYGYKKVWIEEGQTLSQNTITTLFPTIREEESEIWISANRGSSNDAFSRLVLKKAEAELARCGYYEDDDMIVVELNYRDNPWFPAVLEKERLKDFREMPRSLYDHIWEGKYADTVENAIILPEWFDACVDAHLVLGFKPLGREVVAYDPSDTSDPRAYAHRHGVVILRVEENTTSDVNEATDWATGHAAEAKADAFIWDADGLGVSLRRQVGDALEGKKCDAIPFHGGAEPEHPDALYEPLGDGNGKARSNADTFYNLRAQKYWGLRDRCYRTYLAVVHKKYTDPEELISFAAGPWVQQLRSELCRIPRKPNGSGRIQILSKVEMKAKGIPSPNMADAVMMSFSGGDKALKRRSRGVSDQIQHQPGIWAG